MICLDDCKHPSKSNHLFQNTGHILLRKLLCAKSDSLNIRCPLKMRMDNGPELVSPTLAQWAKEHDVVLEFKANTKCLYRTFKPDVPNRSAGFLPVQNIE